MFYYIRSLSRNSGIFERHLFRMFFWRVVVFAFYLSKKKHFASKQPSEKLPMFPHFRILIANNRKFAMKNLQIFQNCNLRVQPKKMRKKWKIVHYSTIFRLSARNCWDIRRKNFCRIVQTAFFYRRKRSRGKKFPRN